MYKTPDYDYEQLSFTSFNSTCGMQLDPDNEWICIARKLPWRAWESLYSVLFPSGTGNVAKPCMMVIGSLIIQMRMGFTDRDLVLQIQQNPYYQYFIGLESFQHDAPYSRTLLVEWRKRLDLELVIKVNERARKTVVLIHNNRYRIHLVCTGFLETKQTIFAGPYNKVAFAAS